MVKDNKSLTEKMKDLEEKTQWFYSDDFNLDEAAQKYKEAVELAKELQKDLSNLTNEIEVLSEDFTK